MVKHMKPTRIYLGIGRGSYLVSHSQYLDVKAYIMPDIALIPHTKATYLG